MQKIAELMRQKAQELLSYGQVQQVAAWRRGQLA